LVLRFANTMTINSQPSPSIGESTQGVPGEGVVRDAVPRVPLTPSLPQRGEGNEMERPVHGVFGGWHFRLGLANEPVVRCVCANPEPDEPIGGLDRDRTVTQTNARRPEAADFLEMERRVPGIGLQQAKRLVGELLHGRRQNAITNPEVWRGMVIHSLVDLPAAWSRRARSAKSSSFPAFTSSSN